MKNALPGIIKPTRHNYDPTIETIHFRTLSTLLLLVVFWFINLPAGSSQTINDDGSLHSVNAVGTTQDLTLPNNPQIAEISFSLIGGDGGTAEVHDQITIPIPIPPWVYTTYYSASSDGGNGANVSVTYAVGNGSQEIPPGSIIRFVEGRRGQNGSSQGVAGAGVDYGGGGGGSAVLYNPPGPTGWILLAVAGGGGGAYQGMFAFSDVDGDNGQGGRQGQGNGTGGDGNILFGGGGGGSLSDGGGVICVDLGGSTTTAGEGGAGGSGVGYGGSADGCFSLVWRNGGSGYGGGGAGAGVGGGGGGYTGGNAGAATEAGSGGGSFVRTWATNSNKSNGGTDSSPNDGTITYQVTLNALPVVSCKNATLYLDPTGQATLDVTDVENSSSDPDGSIVNKSLSKTSFNCNDVGGTQSVTLTVTDNNGGEATCTATVTVVDNVVPTALCKDITVQLDDMGHASITGADVDNGSSDACGIQSLSVSTFSFTTADLGPNTVTLSVTDVNGNSNICFPIVTVEDNVPPDAQCKNITVQLDALGHVSITAAQVDNGSSDASGIASLEIDKEDFTCAEVGPNTVTLTVTDVNNNSSTCTARVTVVDNKNPIAICKNITVQLDASGQVSITAADVNDGSSDACGIQSLVVSPSSFTCAEVGPRTVTLTVTDVNNNFSTCTATVTVEDKVPPVALCRDITIELDKYGQASIVATDIDNGSSDACGIASLVASQTVFTCAHLDENDIILTVTDVNGNSSMCTATVTVEDNLVPIVRTQDVTVILDKYGQASVTPEMIDDRSTDNCSIVDRWLEGLTEYDCGSVGTHRVKLFVEDQSGNIGYGYADVTVEFFEPDFTNKYGVANGDTVHIVDCLPWTISQNDLVNYKTIKKHATLRSLVYRQELPENAPWGMYELWKYVYEVEDDCYHTHRFSFYLALYDLAPPTYQYFPDDTTVATIADVPEVDEDVKIIDVCLYVVWDTVVTMPFLDSAMMDTIGFTRRWMAIDPVGHESFRDQMIWISSGDRDQYGLITGRIADEDHIRNARFFGEAGRNGIPVSLYRIDTIAGLRTWVDNWTTGDWQGAQGRYYFVLEDPGMYQVKIDSAICLVDTLKFDKYLWSDTLEVKSGQTINQGWVISHPCTGVEVVEPFVAETVGSRIPKVEQPQQTGTIKWTIYPNPSTGYLRIEIDTDELLEYRLYDVLGRSVKSGHYQHGETIDVRGINTGLYHLQLMDQKEILGTKKVMFMN